MIVYRLRQLKHTSPERIARLQQEVEDGLHGFLEYEPLRDGLADVEKLPYLSPALEGSLLAAALRNEAAVDANVAQALERITRPGRR